MTTCEDTLQSCVLEVECRGRCQDLHASSISVLAMKFALFGKGLMHGQLVAAKTAEIKLHAWCKYMLDYIAGAMGEGSH